MNHFYTKERGMLNHITRSFDKVDTAFIPPAAKVTETIADTAKQKEAGG